MTALITVPACPESLAAREAPDSGLPVPRDFPYPMCCVCRFPIPPWDLAGGDYEPRHTSTCTRLDADPVTDVTAASPDMAADR